jgi:hypothetical protein
MFGLTSPLFKYKVLKLLAEEFDFVPQIPGVHTSFFNAVCKKVKEVDGNHYDAASLFMGQLIALPCGADTSDAVEEYNRSCTAIIRHLDDHMTLDANALLAGITQEMTP